MASTRSRRCLRTLAILIATAAFALMTIGYVAMGAAEKGGAQRDAGCPAEDEGSRTGPVDLWEEAGTGPSSGTFPESLQGDEDPSQRDVLLVDEDVVDVAADLLRGYRDRQDALLAYGGWVDLTGNAWGCVVQGPGWVEVRLVSAEGSTGGSKVETIRMEVSEWRDAYGSEVADSGEREPPA